MATRSTRRKKPTKKPAPQRKPNRRSSNGADSVEKLSRALFRAEVAGVLLVLLAVFTLLSLLTASRGQLTGGWVDLLQSLFGRGVWGVPLVLGLLGLWVVIRAVDQMPNLPWQRPAGLSILFVAVITAISLLFDPILRSRMAAEGDAGGVVGQFLADTLQQSLSAPGAWAVVTFLALAGVFLLFDQALLDAWYALSNWSSTREHERTPTASLPVKSMAPMPSGEIPWWKRLFWPQQREESIFISPTDDRLVRAEPSSAVPVQPMSGKGKPPAVASVARPA
ncbi:MAG: DNA translocase FtsK 4TM domain-containing protein, partial [Caldilinea sp.]